MFKVYMNMFFKLADGCDFRKGVTLNVPPAGSVPSASAASAPATAASALHSRIKSNVPKIYGIMNSCQDKVAGLTQPAMDEIVALCISADLAYKKNILGRHCGIHPENRARTGVDPFNAQNLALRISCQGYSESRLENPMGFEKAESGQAASAQKEFMIRNFDMSNGYLRTIPFHDVEYLPVTGSAHICCR